jgi:hypothetical protein
LVIGSIRSEDLMTTFNDLSRDFSAAEWAASRATRAREADKVRRRGSISARVVDFLTETPSEEAERVALEKLAFVTEDTRVKVAALLAETAMSFTLEDIGATASRSAQADRVSTAADDRDRAVWLLRLAASAAAALDAAVKQCRSAATMELADALSSNKAISLMSTGSTSSAKTKVRDAKEALEAFAAALPDGKHSRLDAQVPDDMFDLVLDMLDFPIDFTSWLNRSKLNEAGARCEAAAGKLSPLVRDLQGNLEAASNRHQAEIDGLSAIDHPFLLRAAEYVPDNIRYALPASVSAALRPETSEPAFNR